MAAPALATANETPNIALAPNLPLFGVPSREIKNSSTAFWSVTSRFFSIRAGPITSLTLATALRTPEMRLWLSSALSVEKKGNTNLYRPTCFYPCHGAQELRVDLYSVNKNSIQQPRSVGVDIPVDAPDGTIALCNPVSVIRSTSTVGLPGLYRVSYESVGTTISPRTHLESRRCNGRGL